MLSQRDAATVGTNRWLPAGAGDRVEDMAEQSGTPSTDDLKAKMKEALQRKQSNDRGVPKAPPAKEKAHGSEVVGGGPRTHRRKAGGGGS